MRVTGAVENKSVGPILLVIPGKSPDRSIITNVEKRKTSQALFCFLIILVKVVNPTKIYKQSNKYSPPRINNILGPQKIRSNKITRNCSPLHIAPIFLPLSFLLKVHRLLSFRFGCQLSREDIHNSKHHLAPNLISLPFNYFIS